MFRNVIRNARRNPGGVKFFGMFAAINIHSFYEAMNIEKRTKEMIADWEKKIQGGLPEKITIDKSCANKAGIDAINFQLVVFHY